MKNLQTIDTLLGILADLVTPLVAERFEQTAKPVPPNWCFDDCATV